MRVLRATAGTDCDFLPLRIPRSTTSTRNGEAMNCEACGRNITTTKAVRVEFPEFRTTTTHETLRASDWQKFTQYDLCADCGHGLRRQIADTWVRFLASKQKRKRSSKIEMEPVDLTKYDEFRDEVRASLRKG